MFFTHYIKIIHTMIIMDSNLKNMLHRIAIIVVNGLIGGWERGEHMGWATRYDSSRYLLEGELVTEMIKWQ